MTSHPSTSGNWRALRLCSGAVAGLFETDSGDADDWALAAALCARCPVLAQCRDELARTFPGWGPGRRRANPTAVVWAGAIFSPERRLWTRHGLTRASAARDARTRRQPAPAGPPRGLPAPVASPRPTATTGRTR